MATAETRPAGGREMVRTRVVPILAALRSQTIAAHVDGLAEDPCPAEYADRIMEFVADALREQEEALREAQHTLTTLHNLTATDLPDAYEDALREGLDPEAARECQREVSWTIDATDTLAHLDHALSDTPTEGGTDD